MQLRVTQNCEMGHHCCSKQKVKRGLWSPDEDEKLLKYITTHGHGSWSSVPKLAGLQRCGKSCRLRWINYLRPDLKRGSFMEEEERTIIEVHRILGNRWAQIAKHLPGRTDNEVKNFWNSCIKKKLIAQGLDPSTHNLLSPHQKHRIGSNASKSHSSNSNQPKQVFSVDHNYVKATTINEENPFLLQNGNCSGHVLSSNMNENSNIGLNVQDHGRPHTLGDFPTQCSMTNMLITYPWLFGVIDEISTWDNASLETIVQAPREEVTKPNQENIFGDVDIDDELKKLHMGQGNLGASFGCFDFDLGFEDYSAVAANSMYGDMAAMDRVEWDC